MRKVHLLFIFLLIISLALFSAQKVLVVYSPAQPELNNLVAREFEKKYGIKVQMVTAGTGELIARIKAEAKNPQADVMFTGGVDSVASIKDLLEEYVTVNDPYLTDRSKDHPWYTALYLHPMLIIYNTELVKPGEVKGWRDLLNPKWKGKVLMPDPRRSGSAFGELMIMLGAFGKYDLGWDYVKRLVQNLVIVPKSSLTYKYVVNGEYPLGLTHEHNIYHYKKGGAPVDAIYPIEGTALRPDAVYIIKGAKHLEEAKLFVDFVTSKEMQEKFAEMGFRPNRIDVKPPEGFPPADQIKTVDYDPFWGAINRQNILKRWEYIVTHKEEIAKLYEFEEQFPLK
ncbi:MAG: iron ABC transporter substrate-binding protein [Thermotoga sp.]|nr:MAG: iron ABC transporter substrate-binding protein [Thermotoga sp.]HDM70166.1 extracellular solute-binding protein [Thermotogales bacterium]